MEFYGLQAKTAVFAHESFADRCNKAGNEHG